MKLKKLLVVIMTAWAGSTLSVQAETPHAVFTPEQEARIGEVAADYLVAHPEILVQVSQKLQAQQQERQQQQAALKVMDNQEALLRDPGTPVIGPETATVAVIEFFDYQCVFCSRLAPTMEKVMKAHPEVRFVFKEWPIFASKWQNSEKAALQGLAIWKSRGAEGYLRYHNGLYHSGHIEGDLTASDIDAAVKVAGGSTLALDDFRAQLEQNNTLAQALGLTGTPGLIVMPVSGSVPSTITVFPGLATEAQLKAAIQKAGSAKK